MEMITAYEDEEGALAEGIESGPEDAAPTKEDRNNASEMMEEPDKHDNTTIAVSPATNEKKQNERVVDDMEPSIAETTCPPLVSPAVPTVPLVSVSVSASASASEPEPILDIMGSPEKSPATHSPSREQNIPIGEITVGSTVAVQYKLNRDPSSADEGAGEEGWAMATVIRIKGNGEAFEVEDADFDDGSPVKSRRTNFSPSSSRRTLCFTVPREKVRYLAPDEITALCLAEKIRIKQRVLALFPGTSCLYPANVISNPSRRRKTKDFLVKFIDDSVPSRAVPARFVIPQ